MKKRILASLLAVCMCLGLTTGALAVERATLTLSAPEALPAVGETFTVTVSITDNPGICAVQFTVESDDAVVECVSAKIGGALSGALAATNPDASNGAIIAAANTQTMEEDGTLGVLTYRVVAQGDAGLRLSGIVLTDGDGKDASYTTAADVLPADSEPETGEAGDGVGGSQPPVIPEIPQTPAAPVTPAQPAETAPQTSFTDVPTGFWAETYIQKATEAGLFQGYADGSFKPNQNVTRIQFITVLWRNAGRPAASQVAPFSDVNTSADTDFAKAASWGYEKGYITGYENADGTISFRPNGTITRQQAMAILFRYSGASSGAELMLTGIYDGQFSDSGQIASYAKDAMYWAVYNGYINGTSATTLSPNGLATRAQLAKILVEYLEKSEM